MKVLLVADTPEPRVAADRLVASSDGTAWDLTVSSNVWLSPVTLTAFLRPLPLTDEWATTWSGDFSRLEKADYSLITPDAWIENHRRGDGDVYLEAVDETAFAEIVTTSASIAVNRGLFFSFYFGGIGDETEQVFECGVGTPGGASTVSLRIRGNGDVDLFKGTVLLKTYDLSSLPTTVTGGRTSGKSVQLSGRTVSFLWIPCRRRELLIYSPTTGGGFSHVFSDLDPDSINTITTNSPVFWKVRTGRPSVQLALLRYKTSGTLYGPSRQFRYAPATGRVFSSLEAADTPGTTAYATSLVIANTLGAFTPNGADDTVRVKVAMSGPGTESPTIYAVDAFSERTTTATANAEYDLTCECSELGFEVDEEGRGKIAFAMPRPEESLLPKIGTTHERPFRLAVQNDTETEEVDVMRGTLEAPERIFGRDEGGAFDVLRFSGWDRTREFGKYYFVDSVPYDGVPLVTAVANLATMVGFSLSDLIIPSVGTEPFELPFSTGVSNGEWQLLPERDETVDDWIERFYRDYAPTWHKGWRPTLTGNKWEFVRPDDLSTTPIMDLFCSREAAITFGILPEVAEERVLFAGGRRRRVLPPESNSVLAIGYDPRLAQYVWAQYNDAGSQAAGTVPGSRPDNWLGRVERYQLIDTNGLSTQDAVNRAVLLLADRLTNERVREEWECPWLVRVTDTLPVWRGDVLRLYETVTDVATGTYTDWRVKALKVNIRYTGSGDNARKVRVSAAQYTVEKIGEGP